MQLAAGVISISVFLDDVLSEAHFIQQNHKFHEQEQAKSSQLTLDLFVVATKIYSEPCLCKPVLVTRAFLSTPTPNHTKGDKIPIIIQVM